MQFFRTTLLVSTLLLLSAASALADLSWNQRQVELAAALNDEQAIADFTFTNTGDVPVTITEIKPSCGCTTAKLDKLTYAPGETGTIHAVFTLGDRRGKQTKRIIVRSDDEQSPVTTLTFRVNIPEVLRIRPRLIYWRPGEPRESKTLDVKVVHDEPLRVLKAKTDDEAVAAQLETVEPGKHYRVTLTPVSQSAAANVAVRLVTDLPQETEEDFKGFRVLARLMLEAEEQPVARSE